MSRTALAFMSYVNEDDRHDNGWMTQFRERLSGEVRMHTGEPFDIFQDRKDIAWGQQWQERINQSLDAVTFLIPILTPAFFKNTACRDELERFLKREKELGRNDLILPIHYIECPVLKDNANDSLAESIAAHQYTDWRDLRDDSFTTRKVRKALAKLAQQIIKALEGSQAEVSRQQPEKDNSTPPAPAAKPEPPTVVVDAMHRGDFATITEALKVVKPGTRILVRPGLYIEDIVIDKPVEIIGDGERSDIVIEAPYKASDREHILFKTDIGRMANLTLRYNAYPAFFFGICVAIAQGRLDLEDCDILGGELGACVKIHNGADPRLRRNRIYDGNGYGVYICKAGRGTLEGNEIFSNSIAGVAIKRGGNPILRRNRISQNRCVGIQIEDDGGGIFEDNDLRDNVEGAWKIAPDCEANVQRRGNKE